MDQHIRSEITEGLRQRGIDVLTAFEDSRSEAEDDELLERATSHTWFRRNNLLQ
jgi:hypothetical protein